MTPTSLALVLAAAVIHASWNLLAKRIGGGGGFVWIVAVIATVVYTPINFALDTFAGMTWNATTLLFLLGSGVLQTLYFVTLQRGYKVGDLSLVYPLARGTGPLFATLGAILLLGERPTPLALAGAVLIVGGVFAMSFTGLRSGVSVRWAVGYGLLTGMFIAGYTLWDKVAVSTLAIPPVLLDTATALVRTLLLLPLALHRWPEVTALWRNHAWGLIAVAFFSSLSYILVLFVLQTTPVSYVAPLREVSILIGTVMGARLLAEGHLRSRLVAASAIVLGVIAIALG